MFHFCGGWNGRGGYSRGSAYRGLLENSYDLSLDLGKLGLKHLGGHRSLACGNHATMATSKDCFAVAFDGRERRKRRRRGTRGWWRRDQNRTIIVTLFLILFATSRSRGTVCSGHRAQTWRGHLLALLKCLAGCDLSVLFRRIRVQPNAPARQP